ncbi:hypothetical protein B0A52_08608 [Exophiala mesophila]|uniref:ERCC4 domain-containing protein n=1 Tax=Exophiala mesophila TaxID=212818 RepID=A0A438MU01_EXOME|nr:hypothetical protein B0A52_08608 [Exophiala mesophila]
MPEIIELISSSPPIPSSRVTIPPPTKRLGASPDVVDTLPEAISLEIFSDSDIESERSAKRRRITPTFTTTQGTLPGSSKLDLSDRDELPEIHTLIAEAPPQIQRPAATIWDDDDQITFSSSAPEPRGVNALEPTCVANRLQRYAQDDSNLARSGAILSSSPRPTYSTRTEQLLATMKRDTGKKSNLKAHAGRIENPRASGKVKQVEQPLDDIICSSSQIWTTTKSIKPLTESSKEEKAASRAAAKATKDAEKEAEKERKRLEREQKSKEKQRAADLAEVNKSRIDKKDSAAEMIVDVACSLRGTSIGNQIEHYMKQANIELNYIEDEVDLLHNSTKYRPQGRIIKWRRKVVSRYNDEDGQWEPASQSRTIDEGHLLVHISGSDLATLLASPASASSGSEQPTVEEMKANLDAHVALIRGMGGPDCIPIYLIEGMTTWLKRNINAKNREYTAAVRAQMVDVDGDNTTSVPTGSQARSRKSKKSAASSIDLSFITADILEDMLLHLQLAHQPILVQHTTSASNSAAQISALTQNLSTRPYRLAQVDFNLKNASFCMDRGQVRTGDNSRETFAKMLQEVQRVTPSMAYGILDKYSSVRDLAVGFEKHGNLLLQDLRKSANKDGAWNDRKLGPMASRRLYKVFMGRDPTATDGMS